MNRLFALLLSLSLSVAAAAGDHALVIQTDFGTKDGAVSNT